MIELHWEEFAAEMLEDLVSLALGIRAAELYLPPAVAGELGDGTERSNVAICYLCGYLIGRCRRWH